MRACTAPSSPTTVNVARYADLKIGVVPVINLEWTQKLLRDRHSRGYTTGAVTETILRRMHDYVYYICPQFSETDINFQRAPTVDTSNPFVARSIPTPDESIVVIRFRDPKGVDFPYLVTMIAGSWMSRANSIVIPGNKLDLAMQLILTPRILDLVRRRKKRRGLKEPSMTYHSVESQASRTPTPFARWRWTRWKRPSPATPACQWAWPTWRACCSEAF